MTDQQIVREWDPAIGQWITRVQAEAGGGGGGGAPSGPAGGDLDGTYPDPTLAAGAAAANVGTVAGDLAGTLPNPSIALLAVTNAKMAAGAAAANVGTVAGVLSGTLPNPGMAAGAAAANVGTVAGVLSGTLPNPGMAAGAAATNIGTVAGDLSGTLPNPTVAKINGVAVTGTPNVGDVPTATGAAAATWQTPGASASPEMIDFENEYSAVRSFTTGDEAANATAFANLCTALRAYTTRGGIRKIWFGPSNGKAYWLNTNVELEDLEDVLFVFDTGPEFSGPVASYSAKGVRFMWSGAETATMFSLITSSGTNQQGLWWQGSWTFATNTDGYGDMLFVDACNNWGGPMSAVSLTSQGATKYVRKGVVCDNLISGDNAHGFIAAMYSGGAALGAIDALGGGFGVGAGNISKTAGQSPLRIGPRGAEMKFGEPLKFDGDGDLVQCEGSYCDFLGQFERFSSGVALHIERTTNADASDNSGRYNRIGGNYVGDGTGHAWIVENTAGGYMYGNKLDMPGYSFVLDQSVAADATVLPDGPSVFHQGMDETRLIVNGAYVPLV